MSTGTVTTVGTCLLLFLVLLGASPALAQPGETLPFYGEPTVISGPPPVVRVFARDFTRDGVPDIAVVSGGAPPAGAITVYPGLGDGAFGAPLTTPRGGLNGYPYLGDFNGDGTPDFAFHEGDGLWDSPVGLQIGNGNGTFGTYRDAGTVPYETTTAAGDFDGDGRSDMAAVGCWGGLWELYCGIQFLWGRADGNFDKTSVELDLGPTRANHLLFTSDFTGDGTPDLVWKKALQGKFVVMPGLGNRTFGSPIDHTSAGEPGRFVAADFNGDSRLDLAVLQNGSTLGVLHGNGDGSFQAMTAIAAFNSGWVSGIQELKAWDVDGNGKPDLVVDAAEGILLLVNNGNGSFRRYALSAGLTEPHTYDQPYDSGVADFNGDGRADFLAAWADDKVGWYLGIPAPTVALAQSGPTSTLGQAVALTATVTPSGLTGPVTFYDGALVLGSATLSGGQAVFTTTMLTAGTHALRAAYGGTLMSAPASISGSVSHTVTALPASGLVTFPDIEAGFTPSRLAVDDFNGDGRADLVASDYSYEGTFHRFLGNGDGTFQPPLKYASGPQWGRFITRPIIPVDWNRDGDADVAVIGETGPTAFRGNGDGTFTVPTVGVPGGLPADVNRDGTVDWISTGGIVSVHLSTGDRDGSTLWFPSFSITVSAGLSETVLGDFDGDGNVDVAVATRSEDRVYTLLGNGDGTFQAPVVTATGPGPICPVTADVNGDGRFDLAFIQAGSGSVRVLLGAGGGGFLPGVDTAIGGTLVRLAVADLDGDGTQDLAVLSTTLDRVLVLPGHGDGTFGVARMHYAGTGLADLVASDFNRDGRTDLAVASSSGYWVGKVILLLGANPIPTSVALDVTSSSALSQAVTMTATVTPAVVTGWVTFYDGATPLGSALVSAGQATYQTRLLSSGTHLLRAVFGGSSTTYGGSVSAPAPHSVTAASVFAFGPSVRLASNATLTAQADFNADGIADLAVCCGTTGLLSVMLGQGDGQFSPGPSYQAPNTGRLLAADFDVDGKTDLLLHPDFLMRGNGDGTMTPPAAFGGTLMWLVAADFNADGAPDLADYGGLSVFLNRGNGRFESAIGFSLGSCGTPYLAPVAGDFNGDGNADLAFPDSGRAYVCVLLARGDGTFAPPVPNPTVRGPMVITTGDFNGDGLPDLAAAGDGAGGRVGVMLGLGDGTFENWGEAVTGLPWVNYLGTCDCDGDGRVDLLAHVSDAPEVKVLRGLGNGTFQPGVTYASVAGWMAFPADLNHDGRLDFVMHEPVGGVPVISARMAVSASAVTLTASPSPATLSGEVTLTATLSPADATGTVAFYDGATVLGTTAIVAGQATLTTKWLAAGVHSLRAIYNGDPLRYVSSTSSGVSLTVDAAASGGFGGGTTYGTGRGPRGVAAGDLNGDGLADLVVTNATSNTISVLRGAGAGAFAPRVSYNTGSTPVAVVVGDVNGDGRPDVVVANAGANNVSLFFGNGDGTLQAAVNVGLPNSPTSLVIADLDGNQSMDVVVGTGCGGGYACVHGLRLTGGTWTSQQLVYWNPAVGVTAGDVNGDTRTDVVVAANASAAALLQQPDGTFALMASTAVGTTSVGLVMADFNGDGQLDLATANQGSNDVSVLLGNGTGTFQAAVRYAAGTGPTAIVATDCDGDGRLDLVVANGGDNSLTILAGTGTGAFVPASPLTTGGSPARVVAADFDNNGTTDLAVTNAADDTVTVFLGATRGAQVTPQLAWAPPAPIVYGTSLSATQLNASASFGGFPVAGTFVYTPASGTVLPAGPGQVLSVTFAPADPVSFTPATATVTIDVALATPVVTWATPAAIVYGTALSTTQLNATANVAGTFTYTPPAGTVLPVGTHTLAVTFTPADVATYTTAARTVSITVTRATPVLTWAAPAPIVYGAALSATQLNATASVPGTFVYTPPAGTVLPAGTHTLSAAFTPTDAANYTTATRAVTIVVTRATPLVTWAPPAPIVYGTPLSATQLNATANVVGMFSYSSPAGTVLVVGTHTLSVTFDPTDAANYTAATTTVTIDVAKATPTITWATPAAIVDGTPLSGTQLNASVSVVSGMFAYTPPWGTVLPVGTHTLSVTFTPADAVNYTTATTTVAITVTPTRVLTVTGDLAFGSVAVGATATRTLTLGNTGSGPLTVTGLAYPAGFSGAWSGTIPAGGTQAVPVTFAPTAATAYGGTVTVDSDRTSGANTLPVSGTGTVARGVALDFTGDRRADYGVYRAGTWFINGLSPVAWGTAGDVPVPADYDGDGLTDVAVWRPSTGTWYVLGQGAVSFGTVGDIPVAGDYNGDRVADIAVWRPSSGTWFVLGQLPVVLGTPGDVPVPGDYDGDGVTDRAVYRPSTATWLIDGQAPVTWGAAFAWPVPADYDGDGTTEVAVFNRANGEWAVRNGAQRLFGLGTDQPVPRDVDGDGRAEFCVFRPSTGTWYWLNPTTDATAAVQYGTSGDVPVGLPLAAWLAAQARQVAGDVDGDGATDVTVFRPAAGQWFTRFSGGAFNTHSVASWGTLGDVPLPGDYTGAGLPQWAVFRPATGQWFVRGGPQITWGAAGDVPVPADYDGDGRLDIAVWRPDTGGWFIRTSSSGFAQWRQYAWGARGDTPVVQDLDGDGRADLGIYRAGTWYVRLSAGNYATAVARQWGAAEDVPVAADYDGDGAADLAVWRPSTGVWYVLSSASGFTTPLPAVQWGAGAAGDVPVPGDYNGDGVTDIAVFRATTGTWYLRGVALLAWGASGDVPIGGRP